MKSKIVAISSVVSITVTPVIVEEEYIWQEETKSFYGLFKRKAGFYRFGYFVNTENLSNDRYVNNNIIYRYPSVDIKLSTNEEIKLFSKSLYNLMITVRAIKNASKNKWFDAKTLKIV